MSSKAQPTLITSGPKPVRVEQYETLFEQVQKYMDRIAERAYQHFEERGRVDGFHVEDWFRAESELFQPMVVAIEEQDTRLIVRANVPGFEESELEVAVEGEVDKTANLAGWKSPLGQLPVLDR